MTLKTKRKQTNKVTLIGTYGGDLTHSLSAWTSTSRDLTPEKKGRMEGLLTMLASNKHETPFEKSSIHFLVTTDIATHIQLLKHRIGVSVNAESARYKELKDDKFYVPQDWDTVEQDLYIAHMERSYKEYHDCVTRLVAKGLTKKRAKESARFYLPYGNQITSDIMFNFRSFVHFLGLRYSVHSQVEIKDLAEEMLKLVIDLPEAPFALSLKAFGLVDPTTGLARRPFE